MGLRKKWAWNKIDWDEKIRNHEVTFYAEDVQKMNDSELIEILNLRGVRAHRGMTREQLQEAMVLSCRNLSVECSPHPLDYLRRRILWFLGKYLNVVRDQLTPTCDQQCFNKPDSEVLHCYVASRRNIERAMERDGKED